MPARPTYGQLLVVLAALVIIIAGMREAQALLVQLLLAAFLAVVLTPPLRWLEQRRVPTPVALFLIAAAVALIGIAILGVLGRSINSFSQNIDRYQASMAARVTAFEQDIDQFYQEIGDFFARDDHDATPDPGGVPEAAPADASAADADAATKAPTQAEPKASSRPRGIPAAAQPDWLDPQWAMAVIRNVLSEIGQLLSNAAIILITVLFMLLEASRMPAKLIAALGESHASLQRLETLVESVRRYMAIKSFASLLTGVLVCLGAFFLGLEYCMFFGLLAFLFNFIPNIGSILAAVPAVALALVENGLPQALAVAAVYIAVNLFVSYVVEPRYMGRGLGLSTLVVFLSLVFWGWVLGPVGLLLSAPLTMVVKISLEHFEDTKWIAVLLGAKAPEKGISPTEG